MLDPDAVATRTFGTSFRGYDTEEVRRFLVEVAAELRALAAGALEGIDDERAAVLLGEEAGRLIAAARTSAAAIETKAEERAAELVREAQEDAMRARATVDAERDRAYAEGAAHAEEVLADAERTRDEVVAEARAEAGRLVAEAEAAREKVLRDLARRRKAVRTQLEQLQAARDELLKAMTEVGRIADEARGRLVVALPEAKLAADAAARRVQAEDEVSVEQLESELEAFRLAGLSLVTEELEPEPEPAPAPGERAADEQSRQPPVRVFRTSRGLAEPELHRIEASADFEEVRVVPLDEEPEPDEEPAGAATEEPTAEAPAPEPVAEAADEERPSQEAVEALFAKLRAGREERTAAAEAVLDAGGTEAEPAPVAEAAPAVEPERPEEATVVEDVTVHMGSPDRDALLARRDELLAAPIAALVRHLKRLLADEQNSILDALRRAGATSDAVPRPAELARQWADTAVPDLRAAAAAGAAFVERPAGEPPDVADVAADLASNTAALFAERLSDAVRNADGDVELAVDGVRSLCREWRAHRLADAVDTAVHAAFGRGTLAAVAGTGTSLCWIVDDGGAPCPDAEDNALAGPVPAGEAFPTGHRHPPAHPGCRCVLAIAAAVPVAAGTDRGPAQRPQ